MTETRKLQVVIDSDTSKADNGLKSFGGSLGKIGEIAGGIGLANIAAQFISAGKSAFQAGLDTATFYENAKIGFTTLLGSAQKANEVISQIKKDALATPLDATSLVEANKLLLSTGMSAADARKDILNLGKAISATGGGNDELSRMAVNLQQIKNVGKATALDIKQFAFAGINIYQLLADATGKNVKEVQNMEVSYDLLSKALAKAGGEGGKFENAFKNASGSMTQLSSNFKEAMGTIFSEILTQTGIFDALKGSIGKLTDFLNTNKGNIISFFTTIRDGMQSIFDLVIRGDFTRKFGQVFKVDEDSPIVGKIIAIRDAMIGLYDLVVKGDFTSRLGKVFQMDEDSPLISAVLGLRDAFMNMAPAVQSLLIALEPLAQAIIPILEKAFSALLPVLGLIIISFIDLATFIINAFTTVITTIANVITFLTGLPATISTIITQVIAFFQALPERVQAFLYDLFFIKIPYAIGYAAGYLSTAIPQMLEDVYNWFRQLPVVIFGIMVEFYTTITTLAAQTWKWITTEIPTWPKKIEQFLASLPNIIGTIFENSKKSAVDQMSSMFSAVNDIWNKIKGIFESISKAANDAWNAVQRGLNAGSSAGKRSTGGFASGMTLVGENGPELVNLPTGSYVNRAVDSKRMMGGGGDINVNFNNVSVRNDSDLQTIIETVESVLGRKNELAIMGAL
jgi:tape measure domain-containing protein